MTSDGTRHVDNMVNKTGGILAMVEKSDLRKEYFQCTVVSFDDKTLQGVLRGNACYLALEMKEGF